MTPERLAEIRAVHGRLGSLTRTEAAELLAHIDTLAGEWADALDSYRAVHHKYIEAKREGRERHINALRHYNKIVSAVNGGQTGVTYGYLYALTDIGDPYRPGVDEDEPAPPKPGVTP